MEGRFQAVEGRSRAVEGRSRAEEAGVEVVEMVEVAAACYYQAY